MTVCRYFLQGNCRFGDRCRFEHSYSNQPNVYDDDYGRNDYQENRNRNQSHHSNYNQGRDRQHNDRYSQNQNYSTRKNYSDDRYSSNESFNDPVESDYYANKYNKNKLQWMSEDYKKQINQQTPRSDGRFFNTSTPKSKTSFSFKDAEIHGKKERPNDLRMNERNLIDAQIIKDDTLLWEFGNQWPFTCYCPTPGKSAFPGFFDLSPEELRLEAYNAKANNSYESYVDSIEKLLLDIKMKREILKEPSVELMSIIEKIRNGETFNFDDVDGLLPSLSKFNQTALENMVADEFSTPQNNSAAAFSFKTTQPSSFFNNQSSLASNFSFKTTQSSSFFGNQATPASGFGNQVAPASGFGNSSTPASSFSFKTGLETKADSASSFSFKLPAESGSSRMETDLDIYTPMDKISEEDKEQFAAQTFTLGKIPTVPPPQEMCF